MVAILMMSEKLVTPDLLEITVFQNKSYELWSRDQILVNLAFL